MTCEPENVVKEFYAAWLRRAIDEALVKCADDVRVTQHFEDRLAPFTVSSLGRDDLRQRLTRIAGDLDSVDAALVVMARDGDIVTTMTSHKYRRSSDGSEFYDMMRQRWVVRDCRICEFDVWITAAALESMLSLKRPNGCAS